MGGSPLIPLLQVLRRYPLYIYNFDNQSSGLLYRHGISRLHFASNDFAEGMFFSCPQGTNWKLELTVGLRRGGGIAREGPLSGSVG